MRACACQQEQVHTASTVPSCVFTSPNYGIVVRVCLAQAWLLCVWGVRMLSLVCSVEVGDTTRKFKNGSWADSATSSLILETFAEFEASGASHGNAKSWL